MADVAKIFDRFKGTRKLAAALGIPPSTAQRWKQSGVIPSRRQSDILAAASRLGLDITHEDVIGGPSQPKGEAA